MVEGNAQLHAGRPADALATLERSFALVPSPNTELLVARALRELGRRVEAAERFERAEAQARRRALAGEVKYGQTEAAAHAEGAAVRAQLGAVRVHVARPDGASLRVDGAPVPLDPAGDASVLHEPGRAEIALRRGGGEQKQIVTVVAGTSTQVEFGGDAPTSAPPRAVAPLPPEPRSRSRSWPLPAALASGGVALAGAGALTFFGLRSESAWSTLSARCGPSSCGPADRPEAESAKTDQTIANVGLVVGSVAAVAAISFLVLHLTSGPDAANRATMARGWSVAGL